MGDYIIINGELYHHGVLGMKWGRRRYQNKDGSLTAAGKKRYDKEMEKLKAEEKVIKNKERTKAKIAKLDEKRKELDDRKKALGDGKDKGKAKAKSDTDTDAEGTKNTKSKGRSAKDMSDEELATAVRRAQLEKQYNDLHPQKVSAGKKLVNDIIIPSLTSAAKTGLTELATKKGKEWLGLKDDDGMGALKKEVEKLKLEDQFEIYSQRKRDREFVKNK